MSTPPANRFASRAADPHMIRYTLAEIAAALPAEPVAARAPAGTATVVQLAPGGGSRAFARLRLPDMNAAAQAGLSRTAFDTLTPEQMNGLIEAMLALPAIAAVANAGRAEWLRFLFALADAEERGATDAHRLAKLSRPCHSSSVNSFWITGAATVALIRSTLPLPRWMLTLNTLAPPSGPALPGA